MGAGASSASYDFDRASKSWRATKVDTEYMEQTVQASCDASLLTGQDSGMIGFKSRVESNQKGMRYNCPFCSFLIPLPVDQCPMCGQDCLRFEYNAFQVSPIKAGGKQQHALSLSQSGMDLTAKRVPAFKGYNPDESQLWESSSERI